MKARYQFVAILCILCARAYAQVVPAAEKGAANLTYSLRYSQIATVGSVLGNQQRAMAQGNFDYRNGDGRLPFSAQYAGGYNWSLSGPAYVQGFNHHLAVSQGLIGYKWSVEGIENVSYLPSSPTTGFSGVGGAGDTGTGSTGAGSTSTSGETVLTINTHSLSNFAGGTYQRLISHALSLTAGGGSSILQFSGNTGYNTHGISFNGGVSDRLDARNSVYGQYMFSRYAFTASGLSLSTNSFVAGFNRQWNPRLKTTVDVGPQFTNSSDSATIPSSTGVSTTAGVVYRMRFGTLSGSYIRGISGGGGYLLGAEVNNIGVNFTRQFKRTWTVAGEFHYTRTTGLINNETFAAKIGGVQASRRLNRRFDVYADYMALDQSTGRITTTTGPTSALTSLLNQFTFGISYEPLETHLRH